MRRLRLSIVANEIFSTELGRIGGFGWAVRQVARCFATAPELGVDPMIVLCEKLADGIDRPSEVHGVPLHRGFAFDPRNRPDLMLWIDYRQSYRRPFTAFPRTPIVVWARDPWDAADDAVIATLRIPGRPDVIPGGVRHGSTRRLRRLARIAGMSGRRMGLAVTTDELRPKLGDAYGATQLPVWTLPNPVELPREPPRKADRPLVAVLNRLDPVKRPWLVLDLASRRPDVEFVVMGQSHLDGRGAWQPTDVPENVRFVGHAGEAEKTDILGRAWVLLNTAIHEGLAVSFLEALAHGTPVVATVDPAKVVSRFGGFAGEHGGDGRDGGLDALDVTLAELLDDPSRRVRLGEEGRRWVAATHSRERFLDAFFTIASDLGVSDPGVVAP